MIDFLTIILLIFGVLQIILFFKVWGMTNDIKEIRNKYLIWGIERSGFFNGREKWAKGFENQRV